MPALLVFGFLVLTSDVGRGAVVAVSGWTKFASLILAPLWAGYPRALAPRRALVYLAGFLVTTALVFFVLLLEPSPFHAARVFFDRTVRYQVGRDSPFSLWDWGQYHAKGIPDLHLAQRALQLVLVAAALAFAVWPRQRSPLRLAALTTIAARRVRAGADPLVLPVPRLVLPVRVPGPGRAAARRPGRGGGSR